MRHRSVLIGVCALLATGAALAGAPAGGLTVSPVRLELAPGARAVSLAVSNGADRGKSVQVEAWRWTQHNGEDLYTPAPELIVNPPVFRLAPGARQVVRAGFHNGAPAAAVETAYRLYLQELPDGDEPAPMQLRLMLRIGVPLFVSPAVPAAAQPRWTLTREPDGALALELRNEGGRHLRVDKLEFAGGETPFAGLSYVLPGQSRRWSLPADAPMPLRLAAPSDAGPLDVSLAPP